MLQSHFKPCFKSFVTKSLSPKPQTKKCQYLRGKSFLTCKTERKPSNLHMENTLIANLSLYEKMNFCRILHDFEVKGCFKSSLCYKVTFLDQMGWGAISAQNHFPTLKTQKTLINHTSRSQITRFWRGSKKSNFSWFLN